MKRIVLVSAAVFSSAAWACSGLTCEQTITAVPAAGSVIPSNAPALGVQRALFTEVALDGGTTPLGASSAPVRLGGPDGGVFTNPVSNSAVGFFLTPPPLPVGSRWSLSYEEPNSVCATDAGFTIGAAAPLPTVSAEVAFVASQFVEVSTTTTSCTGPRSALQVTQLSITASSEMTPWLPLARWELEVDGQNLGTSAFGRVTTAPFAPLANPPLVPFNNFVVQCSSPLPAGATPERLLPGTHQVRVLARIAGVADPVASNTLSVNVTCVPPAGGGSGGGCAASPGVSLVSALLLVLSRRRRTR